MRKIFCFLGFHKWIPRLYIKGHSGWRSSYRMICPHCWKEKQTGPKCLGS